VAARRGAAVFPAVGFLLLTIEGARLALALTDEAIGHRERLGRPVPAAVRALRYDLWRACQDDDVAPGADDPADDLLDDLGDDALFWTATELAEAAGVSPEIVRRRCRDGTLAAHRQRGSGWVIERDSGDGWLAGRRRLKAV
jgi:hypothetical protein